MTDNVICNEQRQEAGRTMSGRGSNKANAQGMRRSVLPRALRAPLMAATCVAAGLVIAPTVSSAVTGSFKPLAQVSLAARGGIGSFTPASGDPSWPLPSPCAGSPTATCSASPGWRGFARRSCHHRGRAGEP
jgi:hypothetical protein